MVGVLTLFGEVDLQSVLKKVFMQNDLIFIADNCNTGVQLMDRVNEHYKETDVVIISAATLDMETFFDVVSEIRELENRMRIILILNGNKEQFLDSQLVEYEEKRIDVLYDDNGFDTLDLIELVKQGKLSRHELKAPRKNTTTKKFRHDAKITDIDKNNDFEETEFESDAEIKKDADEIFPEVKVEKKSKSERKAEQRRTFSRSGSKYTIGVFNVTHGAGATTASINLAQYFSLHGYITKLVDLSGSNALSLIDIKDVEIGINSNELDYFKRESDILVMDLGTPYDITPNGENFKISFGYSAENIREISKCSIKVIMGFSDKWNICKIKFFLNNEQWREMIDDSFVFLVADDTKNLKAKYPNINIMNRDDDYKDEILRVVKEDEQE